ncbi:MAG: UvrD-helicase domain-containing protein [Fuerstiella sp.]|nr:UvrD-helicase domain-containing protein [Fuerstiella sp.]
MSEPLTAAQQAAVNHFEGPLLVLAGPGSGKTRVITHRIARLIERGVPADAILALTFTNKAAREMASRVDALVRGHRVQVSTFHRFCSRLLRTWPEEAGLRANFSILDNTDQVQLVRRLMKDTGYDTVHFEPRRILNRISRARNELVTADAFRRRFEERVGDPLDAVVCDVFPQYEQELLSQNAVDFDTLLLHVVDILASTPERREYLDCRFRFVLVDEYQDTNQAQYRILTGLSQLFPNLCATGDPDQSIYGWRGARPDNIAHFERDFDGVKIVQLDENFRSTASIVDCADQLISYNSRRHPRKLTTPNAQGEPVKLRQFANSEAESDAIATEIAEAVREHGHIYADFAVFYRVNALSRPVETAFSRHGIPFQVAAGFSFYERAEIRDLIGYLRVIENPADETALIRVINRPARGIGDRTLLKLRNFAAKHSISMFDAVCRCDEVPLLTGRTQKPLRAFSDLIERLHEQSAQKSVSSLIEQLLAETDYQSLWRDHDNEIDQDRAANIHELISAARHYEQLMNEEDAGGPSLQGFLELASLTSEVDNVDQSRGAVTLMTMHAAKGLEFPVVYLLGLESGLIPHERAINDGDPASYEEERRLLFVAVTRAQKELHLTQTLERTYRGQRRATISSIFIQEMPLKLDQEIPEVRPLTATELDERLQQARQRYEKSHNSSGMSAIMSGSELLKQRENSGLATDATSLFCVGAKVRHPQYGRGTIVSATGGTGRSTVTVHFESSDLEQTFVTSRCPLQPIG